MAKRTVKKTIDFKNKNVLIFGLGLHDSGVGTIEYLIKKGARITATDLKTKKQLAPTIKKLKRYQDKINYHLGGHLKEDFTNADLIIKSVAIKRDHPLLQIAERKGIPIETDISLFFQLFPGEIVAVTGTRGKSTTTTLIFKFLKKQYSKRAFLGGNIRKSVLRQLEYLTKNHLAVLELSSFQLDSLDQAKISPHLSVITNIYHDHLDWHKNIAEYLEAKKNIFRWQRKNDFAVSNLDNPKTRIITRGFKGKKISFSLKDKKATYFVDQNRVLWENGQKLIDFNQAKIQGKHNDYNLAAAIAAVRQLRVSKENLANVLKSFRGITGRQEFVRNIRGIKFYNDTTATSVEAMIAALERFGESHPGKIVMISGGVDKGLNYRQIEKLMAKHLKALVLFEGTASEKIYQVAKKTKGLTVKKYFNTMKTAVDQAYKLANKGDLVLLCPGGSSFNMFAHEFDRGEQFVNYVRQLK